jgi:hypothetical protein
MAPTTEAVWQEFNIGLKLFILKYVQDEPSAEDIQHFSRVGILLFSLNRLISCPRWV